MFRNAWSLRRVRAFLPDARGAQGRPACHRPARRREARLEDDELFWIMFGAAEMKTTMGALPIE